MLSSRRIHTIAEDSQSDLPRAFAWCAHAGAAISNIRGFLILKTKGVLVSLLKRSAKVEKKLLVYTSPIEYFPFDDPDTIHVQIEDGSLMLSRWHFQPTCCDTVRMLVPLAGFKQFLRYEITEQK